MRRERRTVQLKHSMRVMLTADLDRALHEAASRSVMSASEYARRAILVQLRKDRRIEQHDSAA